MTKAKLLTENQKNNHKMKCKDGILPRKEFKARNSLLTDLYEIDHFKSIRHCFVATMIITMMNTLLCDILDSGSLRLGFKYILIGFGQFDKVILIWICMLSCTLFVYPVFCFWARIHLNLKTKSFLINVWDKIWLYIFLTYFIILLYLPPYIKGVNMPIGSSAVVLAEQIRMLMKTHGFIRTNTSRVRSYKPHTDTMHPIPSLDKYLYYLFIPTFVYRDEYPRTQNIRWWFVAVNFLEVATGIYFYSFLTVNYLVPDFQNFGLEPETLLTITVKVSRMILPSSMIMLTGFYIILHSWMNAWAEMLKFADRLFYLDWWNSASYTTYYRKWNIVVHDYLHTYIYRDVYEIITPGNRLFATFAVFLTSAIVHEYIIACMLGFFFPVMLIQFGVFGVLLTFLKFKENQFIGNTFLWWSLSVGIGQQISLYSMEYFARINCPITIKSYTDYFVPRILSCDFF